MARKILWAFLLATSGCQPDLARQNKAKIDSAAAATMGEVPYQVIHKTQPAPVPARTFANLKQGQSLFERVCSVCHGLNGSGNGIAIRRGGFPPPDLNQLPVSHTTLESYIQTMHEGRGQMRSMASQITPLEERLIATYLNVLRFSQHAPVAQLPSTMRHALESAK